MSQGRGGGELTTTSMSHMFRRQLCCGPVRVALSHAWCSSVWVSGGLFQHAGCSALLSVSTGLSGDVVAVWEGESLCVSEPWGWGAEQLQVAAGKSKQGDGWV